MGRLIRRWNSLSVGLLSVLLVLVACSNGASVSVKDGAAAPPAGPSDNASNNRATSSDELAGEMSINVTVTDKGFDPPSIYIPAGRRVRLVLRNKGTAEHHFRVLGLAPQDLLWLAPVEPSANAGDDEDAEHGAHHKISFVPFRTTSAAGIRPLGNEVHAYARAGDGDIVIFTATKTGTFLVHCPLHPELIGKVIVY